MNYSIVFYIIGWILNFEAAFMALPTAVALIYLSMYMCILKNKDRLNLCLR